MKEKNRMNIVISSELKQKAKSKAYAEGKTLKIIITELVEAWLKKA